MMEREKYLLENVLIHGEASSKDMCAIFFTTKDEKEASFVLPISCSAILSNVCKKADIEIIITPKGE
jgi:hypothetical protein